MSHHHDLLDLSPSMQLHNSTAQLHISHVAVDLTIKMDLAQTTITKEVTSVLVMTKFCQSHTVLHK